MLTTSSSGSVFPGFCFSLNEEKGRASSPHLFRPSLAPLHGNGSHEGR